MYYNPEPHSFVTFGYYRDENDDRYYLEIDHNMETDGFEWVAYYEDENGEGVGVWGKRNSSFVIDSSEYEKAKAYLRELEK